MSATTATRPARNDQPSTSPSRWSRSKRPVGVAVVLAILFAAAFVVGQVTTSHHASSTPVTPQLSAANRALIANDVAPVTAPQLSAANRALIANDVAPVTAPQLSAANRALIANDVAPVTAPQLSAANRALIANDVAPVTGTGITPQLSAANRALIANDVAPVTPQLSQANAASCRVGQPC
jgi:hypothetical protein